MKHECFRLRGSRYSLTSIQVRTTNTETLRQQLEEKVKEAPVFFRNNPIVIELSALPEADASHLAEFIKILQLLNFIPVGFEGGSDAQKQAIQKLGFTNLNSLSPLKDKIQQQQVTPIADTPPPPKPSEIPEIQAAEEKSAQPSNKVIKQVIRSGQQIYSPGDLTIIGSVGHGAEVIAEGNIHIYGSLRGKAIAGVKGNTDAHIFCYNLEPELISVSGIYKLNEDIQQEYTKKAVDIYIHDDKLTITLLDF